MDYDENGNLESTTSTGQATDESTFDANSNLIQVRAGYGANYTYTYSGTYAHRLKTVSNGQITQELFYGDVGNVYKTEQTAVNSNRSIITTSSYSSDGNRLVSSTDMTGATTAYAYSGAKNKMWSLPSTVTDPSGNKVNYLYDSFGRMTQTSLEDGTKIVYTYTNGNLAKAARTDAAGTVQNYNFTYDSFGNMKSAKVGTRSLASYTYLDGNGQLATQTYGNGDTVSFTYDRFGRTSSVTYDDGRKQSYTYNGDGQLYALKETGGSATRLWQYEYDSLGRMVANRLRIGGVTKLRTNYAYNQANQLTHQNWYYRIADSSSSSLRYTVYAEEYTYNSLDGSLNTVKTPDGNTLDYDYDYHRRLSTIEGGPVETNYLYRHLSDTQTTTQVATLKKSYGTKTLTYQYTYGTRGNITKINDPISGTEDTFSYDDQKQLTRAVIGGKTYTYTYDTAGNILTATENGETHTYQYTNNDWKDLLKYYDGVELIYDTCGNPTKYHNGVTWNFTWENGRQLVSATTSGSTYTYTYTADGTRTGKTVGDVEHVYYYADGKLRREQRDGTNIDFFYDASGAPYAFRYLGDYYYYVTNLQGDVVRIVEADGTVVATYKYDAWGNITSSTGTMASVNPLRYRGYYFDSETGFYYLMSRYYDPEIGRFINADVYTSTSEEIAASNMFAYCGNNPIMGYDPTGELDWGTFFSGAGLLSTGITACVVAVAVVVGGACAPVAALAAVTFAAGGMTVANGAAEIIESGTGYNFMRDSVYGGNEQFYEAQKEVFAVAAEVGTYALAIASTSPNLCFVAGTGILTGEGLRAIETIKPGDLVWAWDEETGKTALKEVVETYVNETDELTHIFVGGEEIVATPSHPFYSPVKGWTDACKLRAGDILVLVNGEYVVVEKVQHEILEAPIQVYNFQVADYHTYYVSDAGVLVHNACEKPTSPKEIGKRYIDTNNIDAHAFKQQAGGVPRSQISRYDIYQDTSNNHVLWVGKKDGRDWRKTIYVFSDLIEKWGK